MPRSTREDDIMSERVLDRIMNMADQLREQAVEAEKLGRLPDDTVKTMKAAGQHPAAAAQEPRRPRGPPPRVRRDGDGDRGARPGRRLDQRRRRRAPLPAGVRRSEGGRRGVGRRRRHLDGLPVRAAGCGQAGRRRLHLQRSLAVQLRHRPLRLDHPGRDARRRRRQAVDAAADAAHDPAPQGLRDRRGLLECGGAAWNRLQGHHRQGRIRADLPDDGRDEGDGRHARSARPA